MQLTRAASDRPDKRARDAAVCHFLMGEELSGSELERQTNQGARRRTGLAACKGPGMGVGERIEPNVTADGHERVQRRDQVTVSVHIELLPSPTRCNELDVVYGDRLTSPRPSRSRPIGTALPQRP